VLTQTTEELITGTS